MRSRYCGSGGITSAWATAATRWAGISPLKVEERFKGDRTGAVATHKVTMRWYDGLTETMRLLFGTRAFNIVEILNPRESDRVHLLLVKEAKT